MKIAVCIKQVPGASAKMDWETGVLVRNASDVKLNPYDRFAIQAGLNLKKPTNGKVSVFTMGPQSAERVIREAYALGADEGYLITDKAFGGADVYATSYTLFQAIKSIGEFDLIICGQQSTDGDTAQLPPSLAAHFGYPHISWVREMNFDGELRLVSSLTGGCIKQKAKFPLVISVEENSVKLEMPTLKGKIDSKKKEIKLISLKDLEDNNPKNYGLRASPTQVVKISKPKIIATTKPMEMSGNEAAKLILGLTEELNI